MAKLQIILCDGCGAESRDHQSWPTEGWYHVNAPWDGSNFQRHYACSLDCLVKIVRTLRGDDVVVDELEAMFAAAPVAPVRKPRAPRKPRSA